MTGTIQKPLLRWAGGKTWFLRHLQDFLPPEFNDYHEVFLGGGSVFFNMKLPGKAHLSDLNPDLMNAYYQLRNNPDDLIDRLIQFTNTEEDYYRVRATKFATGLDKAAQFIYLNRTCFNGIYRVNLKGEYNVPYGFKKYRQLFDFDRIRKTSNLLSAATLSCGDFEAALGHVRKGDLVFLDPPYTASHTSNGFIKYNEALFSWRDQERLFESLRRLVDKGAFYIMTNAKHDSVKSLFGRLTTPVTVARASVVGGKGADRARVEEYVFANTV
jgi:DNA adenine methylase